MSVLSTEQLTLLNSLLEEQGIEAEAAIPRRENPLLAPLSWPQVRLWFLDQLQPGSSAFNLPIMARLRGPLDVPALKRALREIIARHEILRTSFCMRGTDVVQVISPDLAFEFSDEDGPFDLSKAPLIRARLVRYTDEDHVLELMLHHIVSDGWSVGILLGELSTLYEAFAAGQPSPLTELPIQYGDYAAWQRRIGAEDLLDRDLVYWKNQLAGELTPLNLPADRPRPAEQTLNGAGRAITIPKELAARVRAFCQRENATLFMTLMAVFKVLLWKYSGQDDLLVGTPVAGRTRAEVEGLIGFFLNTLVIRTSMHGQSTFRELLARVRETALDAYAHQSLPFEKLVEEIHPARDLSRSPLFQVMFILQAPGARSEPAASLSIDIETREQGTAKYDLTLFLNEQRDGIDGYLEYNTDLFNESTIERMAGHFLTLLAAAVADPDRSIAALPLLTAAERRREIFEYNDTGLEIEPGQTVHRMIERQARRTPDAIAATCGEQKITYRELDLVSNYVARSLRQMGVGPEMPVGVAVERSLEMLIAVIAVLKAGSAYVPLDPEFPPDRLAYMLQDSRANVLLTQSGIRERFAGFQGAVLEIDGNQVALTEENTAPLENSVTENDLAYVIYTSGSTGRPKGVMIPHGALTNFLESMRREPGFTPRDVLLAVTTLSFDIAGLELYLPLITGGRVAIAPRDVVVDGKALAREIERTGATVMQATPATWQMLIEAGWQGSRSLTIFCGGEALSGDLAGELLARAGSVWNMYGPTETTIWSLVWRVEADAPVLIGKPISNTTAYILDRYGELTPSGVPGELFIGGKGLASGYLMRQELTDQKFIRNPLPECGLDRIYTTGDLARRRPDGNIESLGRTDHQVKIRGFRIELGEIESLLRKCQAVRDAVVVAREDSGPVDKRPDKKLVAYLVSESKTQPPSVDSLRQSLQEKLAPYMVPAAWVFLDQFPLTANGKVDRRALPPPDTRPASFLAGVESVAPRDELERRLAAIWCDVLGLSEVGIRDNFFELGGHSLLAARLFTGIEQAIGQHVPLATLFRSPTIEALAETIRGGEWQAIWSPVVELQGAASAVKTAAPFFCIHSLGANLVSYKKLSMMLGDSQPFYGLQPHGLDGIEQPHSDLREMAAAYLREIRRIQPTGPYRLGGVCLGGVVAFEMAQQLKAEGQVTSLLLLIDSEYPGTLEHQFDRRFLVYLADWHAGEFLRLSWGDRRRYLSKKLVNGATRIRAAVGARSQAGSLERAIGKIREANLRALQHYQPQPYEGRVTLFWSGETPARCYEDRRLAWSSVARGGLEVHVIPGNHMTMIEPPHVEVMAVKLRDCLGQVL